MCSDDGLDEVPEFDVTDQIFDVLFIQLDGNNISKVPKIAFSNLTRTNCSDIRIDISSNEITSIDDTAFENIEEDVTELQLENNNLTSLPSALGNLRMLKSLSIYGNKIKYFDTYTLQKLGPSLVTLRVGVSDGGIWPKGFRYLFELADLTIRDAPTTSLPFDAFLGFEAKLNSLQIENTDLLMVPTALCNLKYLNALSFSNNSKLVDGKNIFPMCRPALTSVRTVIVSYNSLTGFPVLLNSFPNVTTIRFTNNPDLKYIEESDITTDSILSNLDLSDNGFTQIPEALQRLVHLQRLDLSNNNIITLEDLSVRNMPGLVWISLDRNPLSYISDTAFKNMSSLQTLMLENVQMTVLPRAVLTLPSLNYISLR